MFLLEKEELELPSSIKDSLVNICHSYNRKLNLSKLKDYNKKEFPFES